MKLYIDRDKETIRGELWYDINELSFTMKPIINIVDLNLALNYLNLTVNDGVIMRVTGFCPYGKWNLIDLNVPNYTSGVLKVESKLELGFSYKINKVNDLPTYINTQTGWICIGDPHTVEGAIEFIKDCIVVLDHGYLAALWLKPKNYQSLLQVFLTWRRNKASL